MTTERISKLKTLAARQALEAVRDGMILGLGTGSTSSHFIELLGNKLQEGALRDIRGVPTSVAAEARAKRWGIPIISLMETNPGGEPHLDLAVDGADEVDPDLNLIKGLGRALLREKIVESFAERFCVIVDESKLVARLGSRQPVPVEIVQYAAQEHVRWLNSLGCTAELWREEDGSPVITDNSNFLVRCWFEGGIPDVHSLAHQLAERPGIVEHGLFLGMADQVIVASEQGVRIIEKKLDTDR